MMLHPQTDEVRKSMFETMCHTIVGLAVVISATILATQGLLDSATWAGACGTAVAASGAVTIIRRSEVDRPPEPIIPAVPATVVVNRRADNDN